MPRSEEYDEGYNDGYEEGERVGRQEGYGDGVESMKNDFDKGYEEGVSDTRSEYEKREADGRYTVTMSKDLYTAYVTDEPGVFETSVVSAYDALGRLVARLAPVRTLGRLVL